jgi:hypothetical protein
MDPDRADPAAIFSVPGTAVQRARKTHDVDDHVNAGMLRQPCHAGSSRVAIVKATDRRRIAIDVADGPLSYIATDESPTTDLPPAPSTAQSRVNPTPASVVNDGVPVTLDVLSTAGQRQTIHWRVGSIAGTTLRRARTRGGFHRCLAAPSAAQPTDTAIGRSISAIGIKALTCWFKPSDRNENLPNRSEPRLTQEPRFETRRITKEPEK